MSQKVFNYIGMYRIFNKKSLNMPEFRLMMGTGKEEKRSKRRSKSFDN